jgi:UDP-N-acetylmuramate-alanine ligase
VIPAEEALAALVGTARSVAVAGTHGKTRPYTTEALTAPASRRPASRAGG